MQPFQLSDDYYTALGKMAVAWGSAEFSLELISGILFEHFDGRRFSKRLPRPLERKIQFCRECVKSMPELQDFQGGMVQILDRTEELSDARHHMIHGIVDNSTPVPEGMIIIRKLVHGQTGYGLSARQTSLEDIARLTQDMVALGAAVNQAVEWLVQHIGQRE
jgi:hypothetical protein